MRGSRDGAFCTSGSFCVCVRVYVYIRMCRMRLMIVVADDVNKKSQMFPNDKDAEELCRSIA